MTLPDLYRAVTGDGAAHHRSISARFARLDARRQRIISARLKGDSLRTIAEAEGISHGSVQSVIDCAMERIRHELAGEPRYSVPRGKTPEEPAPSKLPPHTTGGAQRRAKQ